MNNKILAHLKTVGVIIGFPLGTFGFAFLVNHFPNVMIGIVTVVVAILVYLLVYTIINKELPWK